jgi:hypothetical protein
MKREFVAVLLISLCMATLTACGSFAETPGERFRKAMKEIEAACEKRKLGPNEVCGEVAKLKPADPLATEEGRFAHSIRIPNPVPADSGYKPGMTPQDYFDHLCKTEAGEFIYRTVENVEGIYIMRPRKEATDSELSHLYALEDPYGYVTEGSAVNARNLLARRGMYAFVEEGSLEAQKSSAYRRYIANYQGNTKALIEQDASMIKSRYGYVWRGITRKHDREAGIAGGELIILEVQSNEVLAVRRGFIRSGDVRNNLTGVWWLGGLACPSGKKGRTDFYTFDLIKEVLKPSSLTAEQDGGPDARK